MRLSPVGACMSIAGAYLVIRMAVPVIRPEFLSAHLAILLSIGILMLVQLGLVVSVARLQVRPGTAGLLALASAMLFAGSMFALNAASFMISEPVSVVLGAFPDLLLMLFAAFLGVTVSYIVRERNILLPIAILAGLVDYWSVSWGPLNYVLTERPEIVEVATVHMPTPVQSVPGTMIGMGDFLFLALFFSVIFRFAMNARGTFLLGYALLTASMIAVLVLPIALPALIPMGLAVIAANARHFKLKRDELLAMLYTGAIVLALYGGYLLLFARH